MLPPVLLALTIEESVLLITRVNALLEPLQNFILDPSDPVLAQHYPLGELAGGFQARNVLGRIKDQLLHLALAQHFSHHETPHIEEHRDAPWVGP